MPVRLRLTFLFTLLVMSILLLVCSGIYYFSYTARMNAMKTRLTNRATNTARLLAQKETFDIKLVQKLDSLTTIALRGKTVQAYDSLNNKIYSYSSVPGDTLNIDTDQLNDVRTKGSSFFRMRNKEVIAYHYTSNNANIIVVSAAEDVDGKQNLNILFKILLFSFLGGNVIVLVIGYFFSAGLLKPVKKITADVDYISAQNLARRIKTGKSKDEWYQLASTLNQLLDRLQDSFELQGRFISNASHELSTPLTSISSQLEITLQKDRDAKEYKQLMQSVYQDVRHMSKLTQTLLEFAKASGSTNGLEINLVRIDEIILSLPSQVARLNPAYSVSLQFDKLPEEEEHLLVFGNEPLLEMAIKNIVVNACKYSGDHHAMILLKIVDKKITIIISDKGDGIPETELDNIFQPFYRVQKDGSSEGFGLGLALALKIIVLHKGAIKAASQLHAGTSFSITLPTAASPGA